MPKGRLEAFSDGVIAVAITVLALDLPIPKPNGGRSLAHELAIRWPSFAAFAVSFLTIGIAWINHHAILMSVLFFAMQVHVLRLRPQLLHRCITPEVRDAVLRRNAAGLLPYLLATALAAASPYATLALTAAVAVFYAVPSTTADVVAAPPAGS